MDELAALRGRSFATLADLTPAQLRGLLSLAAGLKADRRAHGDALAGQHWALVFEKSSTRTRVSFEVGLAQLGARALFLSRHDIQLGRGEPIEDTARVLSRFVDGIILRTYGQERFETMARHATVPVVNALTDALHPCQILADLLTIEERMGDLSGRTVAWIGDGNNVARSWAYGAALAGMHLRLAAPSGYQLDAESVARARALAGATGGSVTLLRSPTEAAAGADVLVTDVFASMGQEAEQAERLAAFDGYCIDGPLLDLAAPSAMVLHCLPAHRGEEISAAVLESPASAVWDEAENRLHTQKALLMAIHGAAR